jgi:hypothetical protein
MVNKSKGNATLEFKVGDLVVKYQGLLPFNVTII